MGLLARREYATAELRLKLLGNGYRPESVDEMLAALTRQGLLSDGRFAEFFVRSRVEKGYGPVRIRHELRQRGIAEALIGECLAGYAAEWSSRAASARRKRFGAVLPERTKDKAQQSRFLQYRGFTPEQVRALLGAGGSELE